MVEKIAREQVFVNFMKSRHLNSEDEADFQEEEISLSNNSLDIERKNHQMEVKSNTSSSN